MAKQAAPPTTSTWSSMSGSSSTTCGLPSARVAWSGAAQASPEGAPGGPASKHPSVGLAGSVCVSGMNPPTASPDGLAGLAAVLGSTSKDRLALQAAKAALKGVGITDPVDLALIGSGDTLPSDVLQEVLGDCRDEAVVVALVSMFQAARKGLEGNLTLMARRAVPTGAPCSTTAQVHKASMGVQG